MPPKGKTSYDTSHLPLDEKTKARILAEPGNVLLIQVAFIVAHVNVLQARMLLRMLPVTGDY